MFTTGIALTTRAVTLNTMGPRLNTGSTLLNTGVPTSTLDAPMSSFGYPLGTFTTNPTNAHIQKTIKPYDGSIQNVKLTNEKPYNGSVQNVKLTTEIATKCVLPFAPYFPQTPQKPSTDKLIPPIMNSISNFNKSLIEHLLPDLNEPAIPQPEKPDMV